MTEQQETPRDRDRRTSSRWPVNIPASIQVSASETMVPFEIKDTTIKDVSGTGAGLEVTVETKASELDLSKIFARGSECRLSCKFPRSGRSTPLFGTVAWSTTRQTFEGIVIQLGIDLKESEVSELRDVKAFVARQEE